MADAAYRAEQWEDRYAPHVEPINRYVDELREAGRGWAPYVAPAHGGTAAPVLSILRDPGPATQQGKGSGFISVENDDASAALQADLLEEVGLTAAALTPWNAYPWYVNRAPSSAELDAGVATVLHLVDLMPQLRVILLQGKDAQNAWARVIRHRPALVDERQLRIIETFHPSRQALFVADLDERARRVERRRAAFAELAEILHA